MREIMHIRNYMDPGSKDAIRHVIRGVIKNDKILILL